MASYRHGLVHYSPKRAQAAKTRRPVEGPKAKKKRERKARLAGALPRPGTRAAQRMYARFVPRSDETEWLKRTSLREILRSPEGQRPYTAELKAIGEREYRKAYAARQAERTARGAIKPKKKPPPAAWIKVRAHRRRRPGRAKR